jgi:CubicO group peptidase (beta-lactamase class C family)
MQRIKVSRIAAVSAAVLLTCCRWAEAVEPLSPQAVEAAVDRAWATIHANTTIPGGVVAVVGPSGPLLVKGYGIRSIRTAEPVDPQTTLFQVGSVTKVFTAILALSAVDAGRLTLDEDLRKRYPDLIPADGYSQPVTLRQLLAHQGGFDGDLSGVMTEDRAAADHLDPIARARHFRRVRPPGLVPAYDNTGVGLLGDAAARSLGNTYRLAMQRFVLGPLGMNHSSIGLPIGREAEAAACHRTRADGSVELCAHTYMRVGFEGAGALATTGADMERFLTWLIHRGELSTREVLSEASFQQYANLDMNRFAPDVAGMGALIEETTLAGRSALYHTGGYDGFSSGVYVLPQEQYGIFVSIEQYAGLPEYQNLAYIADLARRWPALRRNNGYKAVLDIATAVASLLPKTSSPNMPVDPPAPGPAPSDALALAPASVGGFYGSARNDASGLLDQMLASFSGVRIVPVDSHSVSVGGQIQEWIGGGRYRSRSTGRVSAFKSTPIGLAFSINSSEAFLKTPWNRSASAGAFLACSLLLFVVVAGVSSLIVRQRIARLACRTYFTVAAIALGCIFLELQYFGAIHYSGAHTWPIIAWRLLYHLALIAALIATFLAIRAVARGSNGGLRARDWIGLGASACCFLAFLTCTLVWRALM